jgi:hypothetical protein
MTGKSEEDHREVEARNATRAAAGLPLLDVPAEAARLAKARDQADFEREFARRRLELCHEWTGNRDGWMTNMGRWSRARQRVREEMR